MLPKTDLIGVKSVARSLLMTDIHKTEYSPMIVQHPFTSSGMVAAKKDGVLQIVNITAGEDNLSAWQKYMTELINNAEKPYQIYMMINKPSTAWILKQFVLTRPIICKMNGKNLSRNL